MNRGLLGSQGERGLGLRIQNCQCEKGMRGMAACRKWPCTYLKAMKRRKEGKENKTKKIGLSPV